MKKFPIIDRSLWERHVRDLSVHKVLVSRGCVHNCTYCSNNILRKKIMEFIMQTEILKV
jgi:radical SAM superfamily enzyme YgiQ (UPF0313 family)